MEEAWIFWTFSSLAKLSVLLLLLFNCCVVSFFVFCLAFFSDFLIFLISIVWTHPKDDAGCGYYYYFFFQSEREETKTHPEEVK